MKKRACKILTISVLAAQTASCGSTSVYAETLEFEGTAQTASMGYYLDFDTSAVTLEAEEVYVEEGQSLEEGASILKFTEESYKDAVDYYAAAVIRAEGRLTDARLEYEKGVQEAEYTLEIEKAVAEQADFVRSQSLEELEDTIEEHEEIISDLEEAAVDLEAGIAAGTYDPSETAGSGGSSGGGSGSSQNPGGNAKEESERESETESEVADSSEESEITEVPEEEVEIANLEERIKELKALQSQLEQKITDKNGEYNEIIKKMYEITGLGTDGFCGTGDLLTTGDVSQSSMVQEEGQSLFSAQEPESQEPAETEKEVLAVVESNPTTEPPETEPPATEAPATEPPATEAQATEASQIEPVQKEPETEEEQKVGDEDQGQGGTEDPTENLTEASTENPEKTETGQEGETESESETETEEPETLDSLVEKLQGLEQERSELYGQLGEVIAAQETAGLELDKRKQSTDKLENEGQSQETPGSGEHSSMEANSDEIGNAKDSTGNMPSGSSEAGVAAGEALSASGGNSFQGAADGAASSAEESAPSSEGTNLPEGNLGQSSQGEISLFGDTYDLTEVKNLLEREPSSTEDAQELLEQMEESQETVLIQYEELLRNQQSTRLEIQYTYDTAVIAGKLAEITYEQTLEELKEILAEAEEEKENLEENKEILEAYEDGVITSNQEGMIASVSCEEGSILDSSTELLSFYCMDIVTIPIEVSQYEIAGLTVGDEAQIIFSGLGRYTGKISQKSAEAESGTSRTTVNYQVDISVDNKDGHLSAGTSAAITIDEPEEAENEQ